MCCNQSQDVSAIEGKVSWEIAYQDKDSNLKIRVNIY